MLNYSDCLAAQMSANPLAKHKEPSLLHPYISQSFSALNDYSIVFVHLITHIDFSLQMYVCPAV